MKPKVNVKKFDGGKSRFSKSKKKIQKQKGKDNVTVKKLDEDEDSDFEMPNLCCMPNLSKEQEAYIFSIGLGHLLNMKVDGCASIMGHYIVRNFDADRMVLNLHHGEIPINRQVIHEMLGLPLGNVTIKSMPYREVTDDTITVWRKQFDDEDNIRPRVVQQVIMQSTRADLLFKVNIFLLLCNILGQLMSMGTCDLSMLSKVMKDLDLSDIDWCEYVFDCLKETKSSWNPNRKKGFYVGPIILLMLLYIESVRCNSVKIVRGRPAICFWNVDKLREREIVECRTIGVGMGELQEPIQVINEASGTSNVGQEKVQEMMQEVLKVVVEGVREIKEMKFLVEVGKVLRSGRKSFKTTPPSKMEIPIPLSVVPFNNDEHWLFLLVIRSFHIFLFVINLQHPEFVIVDNSKVDDPNDERYGQFPQIIKEYIVDYLKSQNHPKAEMFSHVMPHRLEMPWRIINNNIDCGVFMMCHMETYMGGSMNEFKVGFKNESSAQDDQLVKLRTMYLYKIVTHEYNVQKDYVL
ncbi:unnamed protein product [Lactuca saligna]|uniref:Ubiquitin-like protease family profile domain-containing protein n=1 Tax=Lactuca saligna TaxID=75948 RepID=A0AA36ECY7_LACSI|nr:unnamed protein product [Lactuca saligna]